MNAGAYGVVGANFNRTAADWHDAADGAGSAHDLSSANGRVRSTAETHVLLPAVRRGGCESAWTGMN